MSPTGVTVIRGETPVTVETARRLIRELAQSAGSARGVADGPRTWAVLGELATDGVAEENQRVVEHDLLGRLAVRLAVDKTLCVGDTRSVHALHQGAVMEGSWGDEARIVATPADAAALVETDPDWRPAAGDVLLVAAAGNELDAVITAWSRTCGWAIRAGDTAP